ncbi:MAG: hypothetical protein EA349_00935 [Halomonadaceae bacterium]|nr:MAG: hypothetical protein EA349_00935 [Halomonadaceae bacterium]
MRKLVLACTVATFTLIGCDEDTQTTSVERGSDQLIYSFPTQAQNYVATSSPVFLRFSSPVINDNFSDQITFERVTSSGTQPVSFSASLSDDRKTLILTPDQRLAHSAQYRVAADDLHSASRQMSFPEDGIRFVTRVATQGPLIERIGPLPEGVNKDFGVLNLIPDGSNFPLTNLASLRMQFNEALDPETLRYGDSISLLDGENQLVAAELLVKGQNLTIDPDDDLQPGMEYTLSLSESIRSSLGGTLDPGKFAEFRFTPLEAGGRTEVPLQVVGHGDSRFSNLSGRLLNSVNLASPLLGPDNPAFMGPDMGPQGDQPITDDIFADLANVVRFSDVTPLRVRKDALVTGTDVDVKVAGVNTSGLNSGTVSVRFLSDANGFMIPNPYSSSSSAPKNVILFVDMALNTEETVANAALGQQLLNVPLVGTVELTEGVLAIDALAMIEPEVLGVDIASGLVSFRLQGYENSQLGPETQVVDATPPQLKSWVPGNEVDKYRPGDPLVLYFDRPLKRRSVNNALSLQDDLGSLDFSFDVDGSAIIIRPDEPLVHGRNITLQANGLEGLNDVAAMGFNETFRLAETDSSSLQTQSPLVLTSLPGYPCAKTGEAAPQHQGRCAGGQASDDLIPVLPHAADRPVIVRFSQNMDPETLIAGDTVQLQERVNGDWQNVQGWQLDVSPRQITMTPVSPWVEGREYRYRLVSDESGNDNFIQSEGGLPLQTKILTPGLRDFSETTRGGPTMENYFVGGPRALRILSPLRNLPTADVNSDLTLNSAEPRPHPGPDGTLELLRNSARLDVVEGTVESNLMDDGNVGCPVGSECPDKKFIHLTGMLDADISPDVINQGVDDRIQVNIHPAILYTTDLEVHVTINDTPVLIPPQLCGFPLLGIILCDIPSKLISPAALVGRNQMFPTGPMSMRMRFAGEDRDQPFDAFISTDPDTQELQIELSLDVHLDAPYLAIDIDLADLDHNLRSFPIDDLKLKGPINFLDDGRMQIALSNLEPINLDIAVEGKILKGLGDIITGSPDTDLTIAIPPGQLSLNYITPFTKQ